MNPLEVTHLKAGYGSTVILKDVSMQVAPGEIRVILGGSGCGKSTLLNNIIGLEKAMGGEILFLGQKIQAGKEFLSQETLSKTGVLFQNGALMSSMTVAQNVALPLHMYRPGLKKAVLDEIVASKLEMVNLLHAFHKFPSELSGGMRKRAALARAIVTDPQILFCDEPSAGLDPISAKGLDELLLNLRVKLELSVVIVTHELDSIKTICDKLVFLSGGVVIFDGTLQDAIQCDQEEVRNFFARKTQENWGDHKLLDFFEGGES
jgi:phospholipid/cholesterol/gamma-HCH transport system ATP-binding protein